MTTPITPTEELREKAEQLARRIEDWHGYYDESMKALDEHAREFADSTSWAGELRKEKVIELATNDILALFEQFATRRVIEELKTFPEFASAYSFEKQLLTVDYVDGTNSGILPARVWMNKAYKAFEIARTQRIKALEVSLIDGEKQ
jgi:hypothetical protein